MNSGGDTRVQTGNGTVIPCSQRPDGTWRKQRKVKQGYIPQEEVPKYVIPARRTPSPPKDAAGMTPRAMAALMKKKVEEKKNQPVSVRADSKENVDPTKPADFEDELSSLVSQMKKL